MTIEYESVAHKARGNSKIGDEPRGEAVQDTEPIKYGSVAQFG